MAVDEATEAVQRGEREQREAQSADAAADAALVAALGSAAVESVSDEGIAAAVEALNEALKNDARVAGAYDIAHDDHVRAVAYADTFIASGAGGEEHCVHCGCIDPLGRAKHHEAARQNALATEEALREAEMDRRLARRKLDRATEREEKLREALAAQADADRADRDLAAAAARLDRAKKALERATAALMAHEAEPAPWWKRPTRTPSPGWRRRAIRWLRPAPT